MRHDLRFAERKGEEKKKNEGKRKRFIFLNLFKSRVFDS